MNSIRNVQKLNERELDAAVPSSASWHTDYRDTAYIYIGGLGFDLSEGDIITIFSQFGDPVWIKLARDKETGKSRGFAWLKYEDQRSCDLAVDNLSGASVMGRLLAVDHTRYKKRDDEDEVDGYVGQDDKVANQPDASDGSEDDARPVVREEMELQKLLQDHDDDDPMKAYLVQTKRDEVSKALKSRDHDRPKDRDRERRRHHGHRSRSPAERRRRSRSGDHERRRRDRLDRDQDTQRRQDRSVERVRHGRERSEDMKRDRYTEGGRSGRDRSTDGKRRDDHDRKRRHRSIERHERRRDRDDRDRD